MFSSQVSHAALVVLAVGVSWCTGAATGGVDVPAAVVTGLPDLGQGVQVVGRMVRQYLNAQPEDLKLSDGVHLVSTHSENDARAATDDGGSVLGAVENYLQSHELRIRLPELMPGEGFGRAFKDAMAGVDGGELGSPRGKGGKGGMGGIMLMGLMMGKMMAALGLGGVGLLAMKALMISALALMLSMIIGLKKLVSSDHDDGGGHTVIHASHGGGGHEHRRRRSATAANMAYQAWKEYQSS